MIQQLRQTLNERLWMSYYNRSIDSQSIVTRLLQKGATLIPLDHFAIIDLPSEQSGIPQLQRLFEMLGYAVRGSDYLPKKQNDFTWIAEKNCEGNPASEVLPQIVIADFRLHEMPEEVRSIISKYANMTAGLNWDFLTTSLNDIASSDLHEKILSYLQTYFAGRDWPLPNFREFSIVHEFNELLAWVLIFGRRPNHFTLAIHLLGLFPDLESFNTFIEHDLEMKLNQDGGKIKGGNKVGIAQSATVERKEKIVLEGGEIELPATFVEFVWRYPVANTHNLPTQWGDYFTNFIPQHADQIIQSLYVGEKMIA